MSKTESINVPCDILFCILTRLPVKSLLRFRSVSKPWRAIISDREFKKAQCDQSKALGRVKFLLQNYLYDDEFKFIDLKYPDVTIEKQRYPRKGFEGAHVLCSHDGLVLLKKRRVYKWFVLWNPSTRQCQELAPCSYLKNYALPRACGLCYDSTTDDYKVILIYNFFYVVGSVNRNCWTRKTTLPILEQRLPTIKQVTKLCSYKCPQGINVEGCVYWSLDQELDVCVSRNSTIIYFDVKSDELKELPTPNFIHYDKELFRLTTLKGRLSLYGSRFNTWSNNFEPHIWIMDEYGWKWLMKFCHVPQEFGKHFFVKFFKFLFCKENGDLIFQGPGDRNLSIYNPKQQQFVTTKYPFCVATCLDSLCFPKINGVHKRKRK